MGHRSTSDFPGISFARKMIRIELIRGPANATATAVAWLNKVLPRGANVPAATIIRAAREAGISRASLLRAKACQGIVSEKACGCRRGKWTWFRPKSPFIGEDLAIVVPVPDTRRAAP